MFYLSLHPGNFINTKNISLNIRFNIIRNQYLSTTNGVNEASNFFLHFLKNKAN